VSKAVGALNPLALLAAVRAARAVTPGGVIAVGGAPALVPALARDLRAGGNPAAVREGFDPGLPDTSALVWIGEANEELLREAARARIPIIAVTDADAVPYVFETDLVRVPAGRGFPVAEVAAALARRLGDHGPALAAALPVLRGPVVDELIRSAARGNAVLAAGVRSPGVGMSVLTLSQLKLVLRIAVAHGREIDGSKAAELLGLVGAGFGFRAVARQSVALAPRAGRAIRGAVAFAGTRAIGEAARRIFSDRS
jgi:uncharacterized protein (DUF697 family)